MDPYFCIEQNCESQRFSLLYPAFLKKHSGHNNIRLKDVQDELSNESNLLTIFIKTYTKIDYFTYMDKIYESFIDKIK